jgi:4-amino-4-deoxy-L-arabinose transferase-like glycosyltransferase
MITSFFKKTSVLLTLIFLVALVLRIVNLSQIPNGLHVDELQAGYQGYKIITTGKDVFGNTLPLYLNRIGDYRPAGILYVSGLSELLFGLNTFAVRFPSALIGALTIFPVFFLTLQLSKKKSISLIAALLIAISPWHIVASRATSESIIALFFTICGISLLLYGFEKKQKKIFIFSLLSLLISYFFYHNPRVFIPILLFIITIFAFIFPQAFGGQANKVRKPLVVLSLIVIIITALITFTKFGTGRFNQTSIFASKDIQSHIKVLSDVDQGNILSARIFHNKPVVYTKAFIDQYLSYFSTQYLFLSGGLPDRYAVDDMGLLYYIELPFILLGFYYILKLKQPYFFIPLFWLLIGPLSAAITLEDSPNIQRSIFMLPALQMIEAYGLVLAFNSPYLKLKVITKKILYLLVILLFLVNMIYFFHMYFVHSPVHKPFYRNDGTIQLLNTLTAMEPSYDRIYVEFGEDLPLYYGFLHKNPTLSIPFVDYESKPITIGKYIFVHHQCVGVDELKKDPNPKQKILFVQDGSCGADESPSLGTKLTIQRKDTTTAYIIKSN